MPSDLGTGVPSQDADEPSETMEPDFRLESSIEGEADCRKLFIQTFRRSPERADALEARPENEWHLLACFYAGEIVMYPVYTAPYTARYLRPKNGRFHKVIYRDGSDSSLPTDADSAMQQIELRLPWRTFDSCGYGLGLTEHLREVWQGLSLLGDVDTLVVTREGDARLAETAVFVNERDLDEHRRSFDRLKRAGRDLVRRAKNADVRERLLTRLNPERFPQIVQVDEAGRLLETRALRSRHSRDRSNASRASVGAVRDNLDALVSDVPQELIRLHAEIERVTLATMIERYESMLQRPLAENSWQRFFEANLFILTMVFARPVRLLHSQFHARPGGLDGTGAQIGDFLFAEQGRALAIVEIKKPSSPLMLNTPYRNTDVYGPSSELSGAVTQVLYQQSMLHSHWLVHRERTELNQSHPDATRCVVVAGTTPVGEGQRRSFEIFRNACKNVDIVTFDELLGKLRLLLTHLTSPAPEDPDSIPF